MDKSIYLSDKAGIYISTDLNLVIIQETSDKVYYLDKKDILYSDTAGSVVCASGKPLIRTIDKTEKPDEKE